MNKILVLLSTYNGEKYLEQQLTSILNQENVEVDILIRDDGSTDNTVQILEKYNNLKNVSWFQGENLGPAFSFQDLIFNSPLDYDFFAFSDQDDVWISNKLFTGIHHISTYKTIPALFYSDYQIVDSNLNKLNNKISTKDYTLGNVLLGEAPLGCTMLFNKELIKLLRIKRSNYLRMHDHWTILTCLAYDGYIYFEKDKLIYYRQHLNNVVGIASFGTKIKRYYKSFMTADHERLKQAKEFYAIHENFISKDAKLLINELTSYQDTLSNKFKVIFNKNLTIKSYKNLLFIISILCNKF